MKFITVIYGLNLMLLMLHEIESAYWKEWEILKLPGGVTVFLLLHIPIIAVFFYGLLAIESGSLAGLVIGLIAGAGGLVPFLVHMLLFRRKDAFHLLISRLIIGLNVLSGAALILFCALGLGGVLTGLKGM